MAGKFKAVLEGASDWVKWATLGSTKRKIATGVIATGVAVDKIPGASDVAAGLLTVPLQAAGLTAQSSVEGWSDTGKKVVENLKGSPEKPTPTTPTEVVQDFAGKFNIGTGSLIGAGILAAVGALLGDPLIALGLAVVGFAGGEYVKEAIIPPKSEKPTSAKTEGAAKAKSASPEQGQSKTEEPAIVPPNTPYQKSAERAK